MGLIDMGFSGLFCMWKYGNSIIQRRSARLDRGICNGEWSHLFPEAWVEHLPHVYSDHCPILLHLDNREEVQLRRRPFRFQAAWFLHKNFIEFLQNNWQGESDIHATLRGFAEKAISRTRCLETSNTERIELEADLMESRKLCLTDLLWHYWSKEIDWRRSGTNWCDGKKYFGTRSSEYLGQHVATGIQKNFTHPRL